MKSISSIFVLAAVSLLVLNCKKPEVIPKTDYNKVANDLIRQVILDQPRTCNCISISKKSMLQIIKENRPFHFIEIRKSLIKKLNLRDDPSLDSLDKLSNSFRLDENLLMQKNLKVITEEMFYAGRKNNYTNIYKICHGGILCIDKPVFDKYYRTGIINVGYAFTCSSGFIATYKFNGSQWIEK